MTSWVLPKIDGVAACRDADPDLFFPEDRTRVEEARAICAGCPLLASCQDWALRHERHGIWGATTAGERRSARRRLHISVQVPRTDLPIEPRRSAAA